MGNEVLRGSWLRSTWPDDEEVRKRKEKPKSDQAQLRWGYHDCLRLPPGSDFGFCLFLELSSSGQSEAVDRREEERKGVTTTVGKLVF